MFGVLGLLYVPHFLSEGEHDALLQNIDAQVWQTGLARRVQQYGYAYEYKAKTADLSTPIGELPSWLQVIAERLFEDGIVTERPDQAIINEYEPGQGIGKHIDDPQLWGDVVVSISLGSNAVMDLTHDDLTVPILLEARSVIAFRGEARHVWKHGMAKRKSDVIDGVTYPRARRVSVTLRKAKLK